VSLLESVAFAIERSNYLENAVEQDWFDTDYLRLDGLVLAFAIDDFDKTGYSIERSHLFDLVSIAECHSKFADAEMQNSHKSFALLAVDQNSIAGLLL
jgi:hypothetical protein